MLTSLTNMPTKKIHIKESMARRYELVTDEKAGGVTYTPKNLGRFVANQIVSTALLSGKSDRIRVIDPAVGDGELLLCLIDALIGIGHNKIEVHGFDTDARALGRTSDRIALRYPSVPLNLRKADFLSYSLDQRSCQDDLFQIATGERFDLLIANPPYVRTQILGSQQAQAIGNHFGLTGRVDLYHAFLLAIGSVLKPTGTAGIIVSNRFMTTKGGGSVRKALLESLDIEHVWDLGDTKLFNAAVLPAVLLVHGRNRRSQSAAARFTSIYETGEPATSTASSQLDALTHIGVMQINDGRRFNVQQGHLDFGTDADSVWRMRSDTLDAWLATVEANTWKNFGAIGKIRVGIKTCADSVFIREDWQEFPTDSLPELIRPLTTHHGARRFRARELLRPKKVVYPHEVVDGRRAAVDLSKYPNTQRYLLEHRQILEARRYVIEGGRQWYEIWVPQDPGAWALPKLVFRDISEEPCFWLDLGGSIVNGDCYWLAPRKKSDESLLWLAAAVGNSTFAEAFYDRRFNNKLYSGRRRFMTQYVEQFPLPAPSSDISKQIILMARELFHGVDHSPARSTHEALDYLVWEAFGLTREEVAR